jgi:hypothetical protein
MIRQADAGWIGLQLLQDTVTTREVSVVWTPLDGTIPKNGKSLASHGPVLFR